ncbi:glycosyltransferase family 4 protein [Thalassovita sp.]|uniref:glycosyltransferase family 4 protein n=1 Tax=Thalassovita sp. TaxID=1979401 RepID=UPI002882CC78|nr:glycosyltransferase family 4 protein [Thalassovita sp.]MDF1802049.1 glycosyltransferase family 4 protein [Thalassovita sp.]
MTDIAKSDIKVAYLCDMTPLDPWPYSGGNARIFQALKAELPNIHILSQSWGLAEPVRKLLYRLPDGIQLRARFRLHLLLSGLIRRQVERELRHGQYDVLFCAYSFHSLFRLRVPPNVTVVYTSDATPTTYKNSVIGAAFGSYFKLSRYFDPLILKAETRTFRAADLLLWPSRWLKEAADPLYDLTPAQSQVVPWGANMPTPTLSDARPGVAQAKPVDILFVGRDWWAKGGPLTAETVAALRNAGVDARLTVVGCTPPDTGLPEEALTVYRSLDKTDPKELSLFQSLYQSAHFIMMPSFESYGFAYCEASGFGLPSLCLNAGGVPIEEGVNGHALPLGSTAQDYVEVVQSYLAAPDSYDRLRQTTRDMYEQKLNWPAWAKTSADLIMENIAAKRG